MNIKDGWAEILKLLENGTAIIVAGGEEYNIPSLHNFYRQNPDKADAYWRSVKHHGFGYFQGHTEHGAFNFNGGGAMTHCKRDIETETGPKYLAFSPLFASAEVLADLDYDMDTVRHTVIEILRNME